MRILLVDPAAYHPEATVGLAAALAAGGHEVGIAAAPSPREPWPQDGRVALRFDFAPFVDPARPGWPFARRLRRALDLPFGWRRLRRGAERSAPDVVHLLWSVAPRLEAAQLAALGRIGIATAATIHNARPRPGERFDRGGLSRIAASVGVLVAPSEATAADLVANAGVSRDRVRRVRPPLPVVERPARELARRELGLPSAAPVALAFGLARRYKGLEVLIEAFRLLAGSRGDAILHVVGPADAATARKLRRAAAAAGLGESARFDFGWADDRRAALAFAAADVVVLPYLEASQSGVGWRALACQRAIVASDVGGLAELIGEPRERLLVPPGDAPALAESLARRFADRAATDRLGARLAERGRALHDPGLAAAALLAAYASARGGAR